MWVVAGFFGSFTLAHPLLAILLLVLSAVSFAALGFLTAIWASTFEQVNFFPTFIITPLTFLGGVFYSVSMLPAGLRRLTLANPVFYLVDGVRFGVLGVSDASPWAGVLLIFGMAATTLGVAYHLLRTGYRLRG
jgi:ABC-2 type transport system permease protein